MYKTENIAKTKQKQQNVIKVVLWMAMLIVFALIIKQVAVSGATPTFSPQTQMQIQAIEQRTQDLNIDTQELDSSLDQMRFEDDIRALRNE